MARSVYQNGIGAWELAGRWSSVDLTDGTVDGGEMDILSAGINWWLSPTFYAQSELPLRRERPVRTLKARRAVRCCVCC